MNSTTQARNHPAQMRVAILQSSYIPWKGYFDLMNNVDELVLYDDVQYTRRDWRNRNRIKTDQGLKWLTIPVDVKGKFDQTITQTRINDPGWADKHWKTLVHCYSRAEYFKQYADFFAGLYGNAREMQFLSQVNYLFIKAICELLGIGTRLRWSHEFPLQQGRSERLAGICTSLSANLYLSGPAAKNYLDQELFASQGISVEWMNYDNYPEYPQFNPPFEHGVTILDLLFNTGNQTIHYMKAGVKFK